ncbi:hypothetical protein [Cellulosimicrobium sp. Marseille-Q4280]|uniref:hypothetical protein n=1 Tax=Cellulosimicrobium sp. Marseille-Q4280 TaxID=2937992 RepID=UPI002042317C|nr:hypothetical protein [Cellulosimicrobium sp. Marseille-Q4280]
MSARLAREARCLLSRHRFPALADGSTGAVCSRCGRAEATWPGSWNHRVYRALRSQAASTDRSGMTTFGPPFVAMLVGILVAGVVIGVHQGAWQVPAWFAAAVLVMFALEVLSQPNRRRMARDAAENAELARQLAARGDRRRAVDYIAGSRQRSAERARLLVSRPVRPPRPR